MADQNIPPHIQAQMDAQAPARRIGSCVAIVVGLLVFVCGIALWVFISRDSLGSLGRSISLMGNGVKTTGTVTSVEEFSGDQRDTASFKITVSFDVDGVTYSVTGLAYYKSDGTSLVGDEMPVIYDPEDPNIALIDTFQERWLEPITGSAT
jgi:hypothetical protein